MEMARVVLTKFKDIDVATERSLLGWSEPNEEQSRGLVEFMRHKNVPLRNLLSVLGVLVAQQLLGMTALIFYMDKIFSLTCEYD